jgi:ribosomal protein S18 acetylase RimI-like enzyme
VNRQVAPPVHNVRFSPERRAAIPLRLIVGYGFIAHGPRTMSDSRISLRSVNGDRAAFMPLLLEADESQSVVRAYLNDGQLLELVAAGQPVGVALLTSPEPGAIEIKNIAIAREYRDQGLGRAAIECLAARARGAGAGRLLVGTADSCGRTIAFYRSCGFREVGRIPGFFDAYPEPVVEDGVQAHDMVRFEMVL